MDEISTIAELRTRLSSERAQSRRIGLVPTMGALHAGHLQLVAAARQRCDCVVMSVFVNPLQFAPGEDFERYPRDLPRDASRAADSGVDVLFAPSAAEMYAQPPTVRVVAGEAATRWEGAVRPGHFDGVLTVVAKLFNIVGPDVVAFGQKDIQQVTLVRQLIRDLNFPVEMLVVNTVRDPDGLALSSRNAYLSPSDRVVARALSAALRRAAALWASGEASAEAIQDSVARELADRNAPAAEYIAVVDPERMAPVSRVGRGDVIALAVRIGSTRLIDNAILGE